MTARSISMTRRALVVAGALSPFPASARAAWPERLITIVSPYTPGGTNDIIGRLFAERLMAKLGQTVIVDNRAGAGGLIGSAFVAAAKPDGYALLTTNSAATVLQPLINSQAKYDPIKDFTAISSYGKFYMSLGVRRGLDVKTVSDFIALAKSRPDGLTYGSAGVGSIGHFAVTLFADITGISVTHVPYRGSAQAMQDLLGGRVDFMIDPLVMAYQDQITMLLTSAPERLPSAPQVPTAAQAGIATFDLSAWYGLIGPANLPREIVDKLATAVVEIAREDTVVDICAKSGVIIDPVTRDAFEAEIAYDVRRYRSIRDRAGISQLN